MTLELFNEDLKVIKYTHSQYWNGYHLTPTEWKRFNEAMRRINKLKKAIPKEIGIM